MPFIRLSDNYIDHPKIEPLSDGAFRLWHQMLAYCRRHQTDGLVPRTALLALSRYRAKRLDELMTPVTGYPTALVEKVERFGFKIHDYLEWNPSRDEENERRAESKERMRRLREQRHHKGVAPVRANTAQTSHTRSHDVLDQEEDMDPGSSEKENVSDDLLERAGRLRQELYPAWYAQWRHGAKLRLTVNSLEFQDALSLVTTWDDSRLAKLARIVLTTDDEWIARTDRGFKIFAMKATWADDKLREWEKDHGVAV